MSELPKDLDGLLQSELRKALSHVSESRLQEFKLLLFPCEHSSDIYEGILNNITLRLQASNCREASSPEIAKEILSKCSAFGSLLEEAMAQLFESGFLERVKAKITTINAD